MIISHKYKYVFIELPRTGSTVIANELCRYYGGQTVLNTHATYRDFLKHYPDLKHYYAFSSIRNPLDKTVSVYFKLKSYYKDNIVFKRPGRQILNFYMKKRRNFVFKTNASFSDFFLKFYKKPYDDWSSLDHKRLDFIIKYESIDADFALLLSKLKITQKRHLPKKNVTEGKRLVFWDYYESNVVKIRAKKIFNCYMQRWGYSFPSDWPYVRTNNCFYWLFLSFFRKLFWKNWSSFRVWYDKNKQ